MAFFNVDFMSAFYLPFLTYLLLNTEHNLRRSTLIVEIWKLGLTSASL
jgi:hypothetical protein